MQGKQHIAESKGSLDFMQTGPSNHILHHPLHLMASRQTAPAGQRQKPKRHASYAVIVPFNSLTRFFLQWHNMKKQPLAMLSHRKYLFFFFPLQPFM